MHNTLLKTGTFRINMIRKLTCTQVSLILITTLKVFLNSLFMHFYRYSQLTICYCKIKNR